MSITQGAEVSCFLRVHSWSRSCQKPGAERSWEVALLSLKKFTFVHPRTRSMHIMHNTLNGHRKLCHLRSAEHASSLSGLHEQRLITKFASASPVWCQRLRNYGTLLQIPNVATFWQASGFFHDVEDGDIHTLGIGFLDPTYQGTGTEHHPPPPPLRVE